MISIIVPIYKIEQYLRQCLDSLLAQTLEDIEFILVDDGSPDGCPAICDEYAEKDSRMKVVHKENGGLLSARKTGFSVSNGDYIGFVDGDDWVESDTFENMYNAVMMYSPDMVLSEYLNDFEDRDDHIEKSCQIFEEGFYERTRLEKELFPHMLFAGKYYRFGIDPNCWSKLVRRDIIEKNLMPVDERIRLGEDAAFIYPCLIDSQSVACVKKPMYHYRVTDHSMSEAYDPRLKDIIFLPYEQLKKKNEVSDFDISPQLDYYLLYMVNFILRNETRKGSENTRAERRKVIEDIVSNADVRRAANAVDRARLPKHTAALASALGRGSAFLTERYVDFLKLYLHA